MKAQKYWMVHGDGPSNHKHTSVAIAREEAKRLARKSPGTPFYVLEAVEMVLKQDFVTVSLRDPHASNGDDISF